MIWALSGRRNHWLAGQCYGIAGPESAASCTVDAVRQTQGWKRREIATQERGLRAGFPLSGSIHGDFDTDALIRLSHFLSDL